MAAALLQFPPRGGNGFNISPKMMLGEMDLTNLYSLTLARGIVQARQERDEAHGVVAEKSPELLLALLVVNAADATTKRVVRNNLESLAASGDEEAQSLLWWTRNLPNAEVVAADGQRTAVKGSAI